MTADPPVWTEAEHRRELEIAVRDSSERCALLCEMMAGVYDSQAATLRKDGTYHTRSVWPFGKHITVIDPDFERSANVRDNTARTFRTIAACCRAGWDPRSLKSAEDERIGNYALPSIADPDALREYLGIHSPGRLPTPGEII